MRRIGNFAKTHKARREPASVGGIWRRESATALFFVWPNAQARSSAYLKPRFSLCVVWLHAWDTSCGCGWAASGDREVRWGKKKKIKASQELHGMSVTCSSGKQLRIILGCSEGQRRFSGQQIIIREQTRRRSRAVNDLLRPETTQLKWLHAPGLGFVINHRTCCWLNIYLLHQKKNISE